MSLQFCLLGHSICSSLLIKLLIIWYFMPVSLLLFSPLRWIFCPYWFTGILNIFWQQAWFCIANIFSSVAGLFILFTFYFPPLFQIRLGENVSCTFKASKHGTCMFITVIWLPQLLLTAILYQKYLFIWKSELEREGERPASVSWFTSHMAAMTRAGSILKPGDRSQGILLSCPCEW